MYANANDYTVWLFLKAEMGLSELHQPTDEVSLAIWKS